MASSSGSSTEASNAGTAEQRLHDSELHNTVISAAALVGAAILVARDKDQMDEMVPLAVMLKKHIQTVSEQ